MKRILIAAIAMLAFFPLTGQNFYSDRGPCIQRKATIGDVPTGVNTNDVVQQVFRYATPRRNQDGIFQELFVVGLKNRTAPRNGKSIIYIHGGGFRGGSAWSDLTGEIYDCLMLERGFDLWLVEYRTGWVPCDVGSPGDADFCDPSVDFDLFFGAITRAIEDQKSAMRFIAKNGAALGYGDPYILWGTSAGGSSTQILTLHPESSDLIVDTLGIEYAYIGFGGDGIDFVPDYDWGRIPLLISHNNNDNVAPWSSLIPGNGKHIFTNVNLPENFGGLDLYEYGRANYSGPSSSVYFWSVCDGNHGLGQGAAFADDQYDNLFCGAYGMLDYFIPAVEAGTWGGARRITYANGAATTPMAVPSNPGEKCACELAGNCDPPDNCPP